MRASTGDRNMGLYESVMITGGGGMLAQDLNRVLRARGVQPVLARHADCDISDPAQIARLFKARRPTLVLNCAADTAVDIWEDRPGRANANNGGGGGELGGA